MEVYHTEPSSKRIREGRKIKFSIGIELWCYKCGDGTRDHCITTTVGLRKKIAKKCLHEKWVRTIPSEISPAFDFVVLSVEDSRWTITEDNDRRLTTPAARCGAAATFVACVPRDCKTSKRLEASTTWLPANPKMSFNIYLYRDSNLRKQTQCQLDERWICIKGICSVPCFRRHARSPITL